MGQLVDRGNELELREVAARAEDDQRTGGCRWHGRALSVNEMQPQADEIIRRGEKCNRIARRGCCGAAREAPIRRA